MAVQYFQVPMSGGNGYEFRVAYDVIPQSGGVLVAATSQWRRNGSVGSGSYSGGAPYVLDIGGNAKSGTRVFDAPAGGYIDWQWIETHQVFFSSGTSTFITATFDTDTSAAGMGAIYSLTVPIALASQASFSPSPALTAGVPVTINTNRSSSAYTHDITYEFGSATGTIGTGVGTSVPWTPPLEMLEAIPNNVTAAGTITVVTKQGATVVGSTKTGYTLTAPPSVKPTVTGLSATDLNSTVASVVGVPVQGLSTVQLDVVAEGAYGSTITSGEITFQGAIRPSGVQVLVTAAGTLPVSGKATDSRGRVSDSYSASLPVLPYAMPTGAFTASRANSSNVPTDDGEYLRVDVQAAVASLINGTQRNSLRVRVYTRPHSGGVWTPRNNVLHGSLNFNSALQVTGGAAFSNLSSWDVRIDIEDALGKTYSEIVTVTSAEVTLDLHGTVVGVGKMNEQGALDVGPGGIYDDGNLVINESDFATTSAAGIVNIATQADVNGGASSGTGPRVVTAQTLKNASFLPKQMLTGTVTTSASGVTSVDYGLLTFGVKPVLIPGAITHPNVCDAHISNHTRTGFNVAIFTTGGAQVAAEFQWAAIEM